MSAWYQHSISMPVSEYPSCCLCRYDSVYDTLATFYDRVPIGGVVLFDDFGWWCEPRHAVPSMRAAPTVLCSN